ncbi:TonB-dependent receptor [uncultured Bacteroides sp.]|uniref:SusC/RagA family TonB-linked outer membrane protein n=1 Tax=uncultured Bacteroides sp. TaxID=162156 RepID=UPI002AA6CA8E|nr:TonB-dependent receptor [uncultured Bacteroides sp.]
MTKKLLILLLTIFTYTAQAQNVNVTGKVVDTKDAPLIGVSVLLKGTKVGTSTDLDGNFLLSGKKGQTLVFSYLGMDTKEVVIDGKPLVVVLSDNTKALEEVVVIGYQTIKKADLTGSVSVFKPETMKNTVVTGTVADALASLPGLFVRSSGQPGAEGMVEIRGTSTFGSSAPLYVIDGIAVDGGANRDFNFNDIESIQVLKDASAAAIYGSRAANGVIIVTTKKGKEGKMVIDASAKTTLQWLPRYNLADKSQWTELNDMAFKNAGLNPANHYDGNTNWQDVAFKTGIIQDYNVGFSGGGSNSNYYISANYQGNSGATIGTKSERFTVRANTSSQRDFGKNVTFRIGENVIVSNYSVDELNTNPIIDVYRMLPTISVYDKTHSGGFGYGDGQRDVTFGTNPVAIENLKNITNENLRVRGNAYTELEFLKSFKYRFNFGFESSSDSYMNLRKIGNWTYNQPYDPSSLNRARGRSNSMVFDNTLEYNKTFGKHNISAVFGSSFMNNYYEKVWGTKNDLLTTGDSYFDQLDAALSNPKTGSYRDMQKLFSLFGRVNYSYDDKYLFSATIRRDASSKFGSDYRNGAFPSASVGWRISKEKFFKVDWVNDLKIRANYGVLGSSNIGVWDWVSYINVYPQVIFGKDQHIETGMTQVKLVNQDLKWEELSQMNAGFDATLFDNHLDMSFDYYIKTTKDILTGMQILMSTGNNGGNPMVNAASVRNSGVDLSLTWRDKLGGMNYSVNLNGSYLNNEILKLGYDRQYFTQWDTKSYVGKSIGEWYLIKTDGLFRSEADVLAHTNSKGQLIQPNAKPGDVRYVDYNDDGQITDADRQHCGSTIPKFHLSSTINLEYKGFDLMALLNSSFGNKLFNGPRSAYDRFDDNSNYRANYDPWSPTNVNAKDPRPIYGDARNVRGDQDRWLENGNYVRVSQLALGYTFPKSLIGQYFQQIRLFVNAQNLITFTKYTGLDPEFINTNIWDRGYDGGSFPNPKGVTFGAQIKF